MAGIEPLAIDVSSTFMNVASANAIVPSASVTPESGIGAADGLDTAGSAAGVTAALLLAGMRSTVRGDRYIARPFATRRTLASPSSAVTDERATLAAADPETALAPSRSLAAMMPLTRCAVAAATESYTSVVYDGVACTSCGRRLPSR